MADFQGKYNGDQIEQLLDKANDIDLTKYALKTDNAPTATKLQAARTIALSGAVTGSVSSDFGSNVTISTTLANFDASKIASGTISIDRLPKAALERLIVVADDTARFALTTATAQSGDTVKVTSTGKMYLIKDESKLNSEDGVGEVTDQPLTVSPGSGTGSAPVSFGSVMNNGLDRTLELEITTPKGIKKTLTVNQEGCRQAYITSDGKRWLTSDNRVYGVLKSDAPCECIGDCP